MSHILENQTWINANFEGLELDDKRRVKRLKKIATKMLEYPEASIPQQMESWSDTKAAYRLFNTNSITFNRLQMPHRAKTKKLAKESEKPILFIQDTTDLDFTKYPETEELGPIGNHEGRGLMMHTCLAVEYDKKMPRLMGLPMQQIWRRKEKPYIKNETRTERNNRHTEAKIWATTLRRIGNPPKGKKWIEIGDRANDIFEFMDYCRQSGWNYVFRVCQNRRIKINKEITSINQTLALLPEMGTATITKRIKGKTKKQEIKLSISYQEIEVIPPARFKGKIKPCKAWLIKVENKEENISWELYSSLPVTNLEEAIEKIEWYTIRWMIEEYHKCLKTGCSVEERQLEDAEALKALIGLLSIIALRLLEMRDQARQKGEEPAISAIPEILVKIIAKRDPSKGIITVREFWHKTAQLGGFLGRKSDGEPGWQTLWRGWLRLLDMWIGAEMFLGTT
jgi:hypothetical protein